MLILYLYTGYHQPPPMSYTQPPQPSYNPPPQPSYNPPQPAYNPPQPSYPSQPKPPAPAPPSGVCMLNMQHLMGYVDHINANTVFVHVWLLENDGFDAYG